MKPSRWVATLGAAAVTGLVLLPLAAYVAGGRLVGPYAGARGLASYLGALYAGAGRGSLLALAVVLGPLLCVVIWALRAALLRRLAPAREA